MALPLRSTRGSTTLRLLLAGYVNEVMDDTQPEPWRDRWRSLFNRHAKRVVRQGMGLPPHKDKPSKQQVGAHFGYWILAIVAIMLFQSWWIAHQTVEVAPL